MKSEPAPGAGRLDACVTMHAHKGGKRGLKSPQGPREAVTFFEGTIATVERRQFPSAARVVTPLRLRCSSCEQLAKTPATISNNYRFIDSLRRGIRKL